MAQNGHSLIEEVPALADEIGLAVHIYLDVFDASIHFG